jgi:hypothetical protein
VIRISKKNLITVALVVLAVAVFIGLSIVFGDGTVVDGTGGGIPRCH